MKTNTSTKFGKTWGFPFALHKLYKWKATGRSESILRLGVVHSKFDNSCLITMSVFVVLTFLSVSASAFILESNNAIGLNALVEPCKLVIDGVCIDSLSEKDLVEFTNAEDEKFVAEVDIWTGKQTLAEKQEKTRVRRVVPLIARAAFTVGRALFRSFARSTPKLSRSAGKLTKQYDKSGNFGSALRDFRRFNPDKGSIKTFKGKNGLKGVQGTFGNGRWTVKARSSSSNKRPTLDIYRSNKADRSVLRKIRYNGRGGRLP